MDRRHFVQATALGSLGLVGSAAFAAPAGAQSTSPPMLFSGANLGGWERVVGDGVWVPAGAEPVSTADLVTNDFAAHSELVANVAERAAMVHNITFRRMIGDELLSRRHCVGFEFRLPVLPSTASPSNGQTVEAGLFVWDGSGERRDHGLGVQWVVNPWAPDFGELRRWSQSQAGWKPVAQIAPDTGWHAIELTVDPRDRTAESSFDGVSRDREYTRRQKPADWGTETAARFQIECISLWPGDQPSAPSFSVEVRDWWWEIAE